MFRIALRALVAGGLCVFSSSPHAQFFRFKDVVQHGDFALLGNTLAQDCAHGVPAPVVGTVGNCGSWAEDAGADVHWRADFPTVGAAVANTSVPWPDARSTAMLALPPGAHVTHAFLYWGGNTVVPDPEALLEREGVFSTTVADNNSFSNVNRSAVSVADVTSTVQAFGNGPYRVGGVYSEMFQDLIDDNLFDVWWMVVLYERAEDPLRRLTLYEGLQPINQPVTSVVDGFLAGDPVAMSKIGVVGLLGNDIYAGDSLSINGAPFSDALNPANNIFNGTHSVLGLPQSLAGDLPQTTGKVRSLSGIDIDVFDVTPYVDPLDSTMTVVARSTGDVALLSTLVASMPIALPGLEASTLLATDVDGGALLPGDTVEYRLSVQDAGNDDAMNVMFDATLPNGMSYVPGSLEVLIGANAGTKTDAIADDQAEYDDATRSVRVRLGAGANGVTGGELTVGESTEVRFRARIDGFCSGTVPFAMSGRITALGAISGQSTTYATDGDPGTPGTQPASVLVDVRCLELRRQGAGNGAISIAPNGANCVGFVCPRPVPTNSLVALTAMPDAQSLFGGWSDDASGGANPVAVTMDVDHRVTASFSIRQAITQFVATPAAPVYAPGGTFLISASGGGSPQPVVFAGATPTVCTVSDTTVAILAAGVCSITATQAGDPDYGPAPPVQLDVVIARAPQAITAFVAAPATPTYAPGATFVVSANGGASTQPVTFTSATPETCKIEGGAVAILAAGACSIFANQAADDNYDAAPPSQLDVMIARAPQAITNFAANPESPVFAVGGVFNVSADGGGSSQPIVYTTATPAVCQVAGAEVSIFSAGVCSLTADQAGNADYTAAPQVQLDVTIMRASQAITSFVANPASPVFNFGGVFNVSAKGGGSSQPVVYATLTPAVCQVTGTAAVIVSAGVCSLTADQAGDTNYSAAPQVQLDVTIARAPQAIGEFAASPAAPVFVPGGTFTVSAIGGGSGQPVVFASLTPGTCSVAGSTVTMLASGLCTVSANQAGDSNYEPAPQATLDVTLGPDDTIFRYGFDGA